MNPQNDFAIANLEYKDEAFTIAFEVHDGQVRKDNLLLVLTNLALSVGLKIID